MSKLIFVLGINTQNHHSFHPMWYNICEHFYKDYSNIMSIKNFPFSLGGGILLSSKNFKGKLKLVWIPFQHIYKIALKIPQ